MAAALGAALVWGRAPAEERRPDPDEVLEDARRLLDAGHFEDARLAYGPLAAEMGRDLLARIALARRQGRAADALPLCEAYLAHFPFGGADWRDQRAGWNRAAEAYLEAAAKVATGDSPRRADPAPAPPGRSPAGEALAQDRAAADLYARLDRLADSDRARTDPAVQEQVFALADAIVAQFPRSRFGTAAALTAALVAEHRPTASGPVHEARRGMAFLEGYLDKMREAGAPAARRRALLYQVARYAEGSADPADLGRGAAAWREVLRTAASPAERRAAALAAGRAALAAGGEEDLDFVRRQFAEFLAAWPGAPEAAEVRRGLVRTWLAADRPEDALALIREHRLAAPAAPGLGEALLDVAAYYAATGQYPQALSVLKDATGREPPPAGAAEAWLALADLYDGLADERHMVEALRRAAALPPAPLDGRHRRQRGTWNAERGTPNVQRGTPDGGDQGSPEFQVLARGESPRRPSSAFRGLDTRAQAVGRLAAYHTSKEHWTEARQWWEAWKPQTPRAACQADLEARRAVGLATCLANLGRADEAEAVLGPLVFDAKGPCPPDAAVALINLYRARRQLEAVETRLKEVLAKDPGNLGARVGLEYLGMVRLAERGDVEALWAMLQGQPSDGAGLKWQTIGAADLIVSMPAQGRKAALEKARGPDPGPRWAAVVLARLKAPEALALAKERMAAEPRPEALRDYAHALALLGTAEARAVLKGHAAEGSPDQKAAARQALAYRPWHTVLQPPHDHTHAGRIAEMQ